MSVQRGLSRTEVFAGDFIRSCIHSVNILALVCELPRDTNELGIGLLCVAKTDERCILRRKTYTHGRLLK